MTRGKITNQDLMGTLLELAKRTEENFETVELRIVTIDRKMDKRFAVIDHQFAVIDQRFDQIDLRLSALETQMISLSREMRETKEKVDDIEGRLTGVENDVKEIYFQLPAAGLA